MKLLWVAAVGSLLFSTGCATRPKTYVPPSPVKLKASTERLHKAVDRADTHARQAKSKVAEATKLAEQVREETQQIKDVPPELLGNVQALEHKLDEATQEQTQLEGALREAHAAKAQVEKDKADYFGQTQRLADSATLEREARIKAEKSLSWYRWHSWILKIGTAIIALVVIIVAFLWITGRLALKL